MVAFDPAYVLHSWHVYIGQSKTNGLMKEQAADAPQMRAVSEQRFQKRIGRLTATEMAEIAARIAVIVEFQ